MDLAQIVQAVTLAGVLWLFRSTESSGKALIRIETLLTGANNTAGLVGDVKSLREFRHEAANRLTALTAEIEELRAVLDKTNGSRG